VVDQLEQRDAKLVIVSQMTVNRVLLADARNVRDGRLSGKGNGHSEEAD
jgi:hypothetical protein